jgi:hypothetical protein
MMKDGSSSRGTSERGSDFARLPLWLRELHAWKSNSHRVDVVTMPTRVSRALSLLHEDLVPRGLAALRGALPCIEK